MLAHGFSGFRPSRQGDHGGAVPFMSSQKAGKEKAGAPLAPSGPLSIPCRPQLISWSHIPQCMTSPLVSPL